MIGTIYRGKGVAHGGPVEPMEREDAAFWNQRLRARRDRHVRKAMRNVASHDDLRRALLADCERRPLSLDQECC